MEHTVRQCHNVIDNDLLASCVDYYKAQGEYETKSMAKASPGEVLPALVNVIKSVADRDIHYEGGNFYSHSAPYLPHTDYKKHQDNILNVVIPLEFTGTLPSLVIFDQIWGLDSVTWCMHHKVQYFEVNTGVKGSPYEYPVYGLTGKSFDKEFHQKFLSHYPIHTLYGLSGQAYPFQPGSLILFDNRRIHCTSSFTGTKTGISLRFSVE